MPEITFILVTLKCFQSACLIYPWRIVLNCYASQKHLLWLTFIGVEKNFLSSFLGSLACLVIKLA